MRKNILFDTSLWAKFEAQIVLNNKNCKADVRLLHEYQSGAKAQRLICQKQQQINIY